MKKTICKVNNVQDKLLDKNKGIVLLCIKIPKLQ